MNYELMQLILQLIPQNLLELPQKFIFGPLCYFAGYADDNMSYVAINNIYGII